MPLEEQLTNVAVHWLGIISDPVILIPLVGGLAFGFLVSISPIVKNMKRHSDREFWVYLSNVVAASFLFVVTNLDEDLMAVLSMIILVAGSAVALPWCWFKWWNR